MPPVERLQGEVTLSRCAQMGKDSWKQSKILRPSAPQNRSRFETIAARVDGIGFPLVVGQRRGLEGTAEWAGPTRVGGAPGPSL